MDNNRSDTSLVIQPPSVERLPEATGSDLPRINTANAPFHAPISTVLTLPTPPSVNAAYRNVPGRGRAKTATYIEWMDEADAAFLQQQRSIRRVEGTYELAIRIPANTRGDISNRIKVCEDYLVSREITSDDKHNRKVSIERDESLTDGFCVVTITPVEGA